MLSFNPTRMKMNHPSSILFRCVETKQRNQKKCLKRLSNKKKRFNNENLVIFDVKQKWMKI